MNYILHTFFKSLLEVFFFFFYILRQCIKLSHCMLLLCDFVVAFRFAIKQRECWSLLS